MIERRLMSIERFTNTLTKASNLICYADTYSRMSSLNRLSETFRPSIKLLMLGIFIFSLAGNALFTPLPIFFLNLYSASMVFPLFFANSVAKTFSYLFLSGVAKSSKKALILASASRIVLIPILTIQSILGIYSGFTLAAGILALLGVFWVLFDVSSKCLYLELSQLGMTGLYGALIGLGSAVGGFLGGYVAMSYGFETLFILCSLIYTATLLTFTLQFKRWICV